MLTVGLHWRVKDQVRGAINRDSTVDQVGRLQVNIASANSRPQWALNKYSQCKQCSRSIQRLTCFGLLPPLSALGSHPPQLVSTTNTTHQVGATVLAAAASARGLLQRVIKRGGAQQAAKQTYALVVATNCKVGNLLIVQ
jgi:hypothetical protein